MATYPWDMRRDISTRELIDELRMPRIYGDALGDARGMVDPLALTALSQGGAYDIQARRALIAKRLLDNELAQRGTAVAAVAPTASAASVSDAGGGYFPGGDVSQGVGGAQAGDSMGGNTSTASTGWGGSAAPGSDFMGGAPPGASMFGTGDRSSLADPGAMTTATASMVGEGAQPASVFGREGDDSSQQSQDARDSQAESFAASAFGRESAHDRSQTAPGWGRGDPDREGVSLTDVADISEHSPNATPGKGDRAPGESDVLAEGATSTVGDRNALGLPSPSSGLPSFVGWDTGKNISDLFDMGKTAMSKGWDTVTAPVMTPSDVPVDPGDRAPVATNTPQPGGRAPMSFATPNEGDTIASPGAAPSGFGPGFSESSPGGYAGGPGSTAGFGAGYSGSADMGNTQGGAGFTTGGFSSASTQGYSTDPGSGGFGSGGGDTSGGSGGSGASGDTSGGSSGDTAGGSAGSGVG